MTGNAFCVTSNNISVDFDISMTAIAKVNESTITIVFSEKFYNENKKLLVKGLIVEEPTAIQKDLAQKLGFKKPLTVDIGIYEVRKTNNGYESQVKVR